MVAVGVLLRKIRAVGVDQPTGFVWVIPNRLAGSGFPASKRQVSWLGSHGVNSILTVMENPLPGGWLTSSINYMHIPMQDHQPLGFDTMKSAAERIEEELDSGRVLLVHCQAGRGRTMCAIGAYLIRSKGMSADEALAFLRKARPNAVERGQEPSLRDFASMIHSKA
ncbi:MAG: dual specificity protein phosphatase family protein [Nitrososphaerales archaeon]|nr:dual specificity protein phosphatase family protein [Nitrososphaerales archaeon]